MSSISLRASDSILAAIPLEMGWSSPIGVKPGAAAVYPMVYKDPSVYICFSGSLFPFGVSLVMFKNLGNIKTKTDNMINKRIFLRDMWAFIRGSLDYE